MAKQQKPKQCQRNAGGWERLRNKGELKALCAECDTATAILRTVGIQPNGGAHHKLKGIAERFGLTLPTLRSGSHRHESQDWTREQWQQLAEECDYNASEAARRLGASANYTVSQFRKHVPEYKARGESKRAPWRDWSDLAWRELGELSKWVADEAAKLPGTPTATAIRKCWRDRGLYDGKAGHPSLTPGERAAVEQYRHEKRLDDTEGRTTEALHHYIGELRKDLENRQTTQDLIVGTINATVAAAPRLTVRLPDYKGKHDAGEHLLIAPIGDVHAGQQQKADETAGLGGYDWDTFLGRVERYMDAFELIVNGILRKGLPLRNVVVPLLGDMVEGEQIFPKQGLYTDRQGWDQMCGVAQQMARILLFMASQFEKVFVYCVAGNHGRLQDTTVNLDLAVYYWIASLVRNQPNIEFHISKSKILVWSVHKGSGHITDWPEDVCDSHEFLITHGDEIRRYVGQFAYGADKTAKGYMGMTGVPLKHVLAGHVHVASMQDQHFIHTNGAWAGASEFSERVFQSASTPYQLLLQFHPKYGIVANHPILFGIPPTQALRLTDHHVLTPFSDGRMTMAEETA